ncbi:hypothetical protein GQ42DRAFT_69749 [Ramicandelaber brevisporus]|nr:hypothetical protein GQ42DRAFT_69749 [Ramicandelaber brevisporus]
MTSVRFPSVRTLSLDIDDNDCAHQNYPALPIILSHTWPSVKSLRVSGSIKQDDHVYIALAMPNLIILDYARSINNYDLADLLPKFKLLQLLTLRNYHTRPDIVLSSTIIMPNEVMSRLRSIRLREVALTADMVRFIFYCCPNLMELKIGGCSIFSDVVKYANEVSMNGNSPVRHLRIKRYYLDEELDLWVEFISNFKNLKEIMIDNACEGAGYLGGKLTELFPCAKVKYY